jgi:DNA primase
MALPSHFLEELRARTPIATVIGRRVKLSRSGRNWKGCCPFHGEKTPSFHVYDDGYHCFGCGAHGDAISFVMQTQGSEFIDAVKQLAAEAGLEVPQATVADNEAQHRWDDLHQVVEAVRDAYRRRLMLPEGRAARDYLARRGLTDATIERFGLGWSGDGRGLVAELAREELSADQLAEAGILRVDEAGARRELFFNRVMFPIADRRGRVISFGGRVLGDGQPKYVNGPESPLFSKRRSLYGLDLAREGVRKGATLVAVEGYMDVIALHQAGFTGAVAPLGTALTEDQLAEMWRLSPTPILCFDGDAAGGRAAARTAELALPHLTPQRSLRLATLPNGEDPDTLVRRQGAPAFQAVLDAARPLSDALFDLLAEGGMPTIPEARAAFRARLEQAAARIADKSLASEYRRALLDRYFVAGRSRPSPAPGGFRPAGRGFPGREPPPPRIPARPRPNAVEADAERLRALAAILLRHPELLHDVEEAWCSIDLPEGLDGLRAAVLGWSVAAETLDSQALITHLTSSGFGDWVAQVLSALPVPVPDGAQPAEAEAVWWHMFGPLNRDRLEQEVLTAQAQFVANPDESSQERLTQLLRARDNLRRGEVDDGVGSN